jgi:hypothetical protein
VWLIGFSLASRELLRGPAGFSDEARQLNQQAAGYADRIVLLHKSVNELVEELLSTRGSDGDHLVGQVSHKAAANAKTSPPSTSSAKLASLHGFSIGDGRSLRASSVIIANPLVAAFDAPVVP